MEVIKFVNNTLEVENGDCCLMFLENLESYFDEESTEIRCFDNEKKLKYWYKPKEN